MNIIKPVLATLLLLLCILLIDQGYQWIYQIHGVHPLIAFPGAIVSALCALVVLFIEHQEDWE